MTLSSTAGADGARSNWRNRLVGAIAPIAAFLLVGVLVVTGSRAAFSGTTENSSNSFSAGTVTITDDDSGSAMFTATNMKPGSVVTKCIAVTYTGSVTPADVRLYGTASGGLATYLTETIEIGTGGTFSTCTGFTSTSTLYSGAFDTFATTHSGWSNGLASWSPASAPDTRVFRFTVTLPSGTGNAAQGLTAAAAFTWEVQNQ